MKYYTSNADQKRLGGIMLVISWIIGIILVGTLYHMHFFSPKSPVIEQSELVTNITLYRNYDKHFRISGTLNKVPVTFMIDTGATSLAIPGGLARKINLEVSHSLLAKTAGGTVPAFYARVNYVTIGPIKFQNIGAIVIPNMEGSEVLLGMNILDKFTMQQQEDTMLLTYEK